jgi:3-hydroxyisobutyrate dehydrogenase-like beta-hydroxyacid dehydrogenase
MTLPETGDPATRAAAGLRVALLGTGRMGSAMAERLRASGVTVTLYNRTPERATELAGRIGAGTAATPAEAADGSDIVISMVADDDAVAALYGGPDGVIAGLRPGSVAVDMSTVLPGTIQALAAAVRARGAGILDAPVSGSVATTQSGELTIMVGGEMADLDRARPVFDLLARRVVHIGGLGAGAAMKLAVNTVIFGLNGAVAEGLVLAERSGIERSLAYEVIAASAVGAPFVGYKRDAFVQPETTPVAFSLRLAEKDLRLIAGQAEATGLTLPQAAANLELIRASERSVGADADFSTVASHLREEGRR